MTFKTCEEYVLNKLQEYEDELAAREEQILELEVQLMENMSKLKQLEILKKIIRTEGEHDGNRYALYLWTHDPGYTEVKAILDEDKEEEIKTNNKEEIKEN